MVSVRLSSHMPDAGAEVHRAGRQERKTDTKRGREKTSKPTSTTWSPPGWAEILFVSAASDLDNMGIPAEAGALPHRAEHTHLAQESKKLRKI